MPINKLPTLALESNAITADLIASGAITAADISDGEITAAKLHTTLDFSTKTFTMANAHVTQAMVTQHQAALSVTESQVSDLQNYVLPNTSPTFTNTTLTGYLAGPATFTIDPAAVGDNTGTVVIAGNLQVDGTTTTINSTTVEIDDLNLTLASGASNAAAANGAGITIDGANATITYDSTNDEFDFNKNINLSGNTAYGTFDGTLVGNVTQASTITITNTQQTDRALRLGTYSDDSASYFGPLNNTASDELIDLGTSDGRWRNLNISSQANVGSLISSGNVGIGTTSPSYKLDVFNNTTNTGSQLRVKNAYSSGGSSANAVINIDGYGASTLKLWRNGIEEWKLDRISNTDDLGLYAYGGAVSGGAGVGLVQFWDYDTGNVGIGTSSPSSKFHVEGGTTTLKHSGEAGPHTYRSGNNGNDFRFFSTNGTFANPTAKTNNTAVGQIHWSGYDGSSYQQRASVLVKVDGNVSSGNVPMRLVFQTGSTSNPERMRISSSGNVGINTLSDPAEKLTVTGGNILVSNTSGLMLRAGNDFAGIGFNRNVETGAIYDSTIGAYQLHNVSGEFQLQMYNSTGGFVDYPFHVAASSCVGIGHDAPTGKLDVKNSGARHEVAIFRQDNSSYNNDIKLDHTSRSGDNTLVSKRSNGDLWLYQNNATSIRMYNQGSERAVFHYNGNTGIRSSNPQATLEVYGFIRAGKNSARLNASVHSYSSRHNTVRTPENLYTGITNYEQVEGSGAGSDWLTASNQRDNAYVILDLGAAKSINRAVIYNQNEYEDSKREVKRFILQGTNDVNNANSWVTVLDDVMGKSGGHEPNPGYSFRIPAGNQTSVKNDPVDDIEAVSYRYWKFIMKDFWASDAYGGLMEIELYEYAVSSDARQDEISASSMVATDVYAQTLAATGDINLIGQAQVNYNYHPVPSTMAPHSIPGLSSYLDMQHSYRYPRSGSGVDRYTLADLGNEPMSWTLRNEGAASLSNSHMVNNITGVVDGRYSMKTGSNAAGGGVAATNQDRYHMMTYNGPVTFVWIVMRGNGGGINSNESLLTQNTNASSYGYHIIRHYPSYANIYSYNGQSQNISYPSGYSTAVASQKWYLIAHQYWDENQQSITFFDNNYPNGNQQTSTANYDWRWNANANTRRLVLGGSEWGAYGEAWGQGSSSTSSYGAIGAFMYYKNSLSTYDLKTIFDYYRNHYDMG